MQLRIFLLLLTLLCVTSSQVVQYKITYSISKAGNAGSEDSQYVKITGSEGETEEQECLSKLAESADFDNKGDDVECYIESDINIGDYGCVYLRTGGDNGLDLTKVKVEIDGTEVHTILPKGGADFGLDDYETKVFCKVGSSSTVEVCEHKIAPVSIDCGEGLIEVKQAVYGVHRNDNTCGVKLASGARKCASATSLHEVQEKCNGESSCALEAKNSIFGDPCHGQPKYLTVTWNCNSLIGEEGPQGKPGVTGENGMVGEQGDQGAQGTNDFCSFDICSSEGEPGEPGFGGFDGEKGATGNEGETGENGEMGLPGSDGESGLPGAPGLKGAWGRDGSKGLPGLNAGQYCKPASCGLKLGHCFGTSSATLTVQCREGYGAASIWKNTRFWGLKCCKIVVK
ncbi:uncharacterized protein LOC134818932 [Bolinopsis microptera]|uniref:uncharacterized protein LOC134818932 n=1 Tax=Bolinopsis microptera TaxID=2820187 RepID=UPI003078E386